MKFLANLASMVTKPKPLVGSTPADVEGGLMAILYRPVGLEELVRLHESGMTAFPPRLPDQPIFYPVLNEAYAQQIARDWNTRSGARAGFVTRFEVDEAYVARFARQVVGGREHEELWVPAEELAAFNAHLVAPVVVTGAFFGEPYAGRPGQFNLKGKTAGEQLVALDGLEAYSGFDFAYEVPANHVTVFANFFYWEHPEARIDLDPGRRERILGVIRARWAASACAAVPLGVAAR